MPDEIERSDDLRSKIKDVVRSLQQEMQATQAALTDILDSDRKNTASRIDLLAEGAVSIEARLKQSIGTIEHQTIALKEAIASNSSAITLDRQSIQSLSLDVNKAATAIASLQERINGSSIPGISGANIESMRQQLDRLQSLLNGDGGRTSYIELVGRAETTAAWAKLGNWIIGTFGIGTVGLAVATALGVGKAPDLTPQITKLETQVQVQNKTIDYLQRQIEDLKSHRRNN